MWSRRSTHVLLPHWPIADAVQDCRLAHLIPVGPGRSALTTRQSAVGRLAACQTLALSACFCVCCALCAASAPDPSGFSGHPCAAMQGRQPASWLPELRGLHYAAVDRSGTGRPITVLCRDAGRAPAPVAPPAKSRTVQGAAPTPGRGWPGQCWGGAVIGHFTECRLAKLNQIGC